MNNENKTCPRCQYEIARREELEKAIQDMRQRGREWYENVMKSYQPKPSFLEKQITKIKKLYRGNFVDEDKEQ